jgi:EAL domain-containing protein (putative c-di-GMP-specific phosphodiesterase class I)
MYVAKHAGRNQCRFFTQSMQDAALARITIINDLHRALPDQLRLYFQPIVDPSTGLIHKAEALLRWLHPDKGLILPGNFIHLAEETGFVNKIGDWVFAEAAVWAARWSRLLNEPFQISVNKSPLEFMSHHQKATLDWTSHLTDIGLDCRNISIEITEGVLLNANSAARDKLLSLRNAGIQVAIDDFGTGYSSMAYLKKYSVDYLKIDQSFIRDMVVDPASRAITEAIIIMAHKLGLKVIAEGVETPEQRDHLVAANCDYTQGFLHSQAVAPEEFEALLLNNPRHDEERRLRRYGKLTS